jgi:hypothetical protein
MRLHVVERAKGAVFETMPCRKKAKHHPKNKTPLNIYDSLFTSADQRYKASTHAARL